MAVQATLGERRMTDSEERRGRRGGIMLPELQDAREDAGLSLKELEAKSGIPFATISKLELGRRGAQGRTARALAEALGVEVRELRGR